MYKINLNNTLTGVYMGVSISKGIGHTDSEYLASRFREKGFSVEKTEEPAKEPTKKPAKEPVEESTKEATKEPAKKSTAKE